MTEIELFNGGVTLVDDEDYEWLTQFIWVAYLKADGRRYASQRGPWPFVYMHRFIVNPAPTLEVDHINGDTLDNRRQNLREATRSQNGQNQHGMGRTTGARNVYRGKKGRFQVSLEVNGRKLSFGVYDTLEEAALVAHAGRQKHFPFATDPAPSMPAGLEEWHPCPTAPGYFATRSGRIRNSHGEELKQAFQKSSPYLWVHMYPGGRKRYLKVKTLLDETFGTA